MRQILSLLLLWGVCTLVHSNTIYRTYRELNVPVPVELLDSAIINEQILEKEIVAELKKDQIPVHIEIVEPVVIINKEDVVEPIESGRNVEVVAVEESVPIIAAKVPEVDDSVVDVIAESVKKSVESEVEPKIEEPKPIETSRSVEAAAIVEPVVVPAVIKSEVAAVVVEPQPQVPIVETLRHVEDKIVDESVVAVEKPEQPEVLEAREVPEPEPEIKNVELGAPKVEAMEAVVVPLLVPVDIPAVPIESLKKVESIPVAEVLRKVEQIEEIAERQSEIINEIIAEETVRSVEPVQLIEPIIPIAAVPVAAENIIPVETSIIKDILPKEEERSIVPIVEVVPENIVPVEKAAEPVVEIVKPKEEIAVRSVERLEEPKAEKKEEKLDMKLEEKKPEEKLIEKLEVKLEDKVVEEKKEILKEDKLKVKDEEGAVRAVDEKVIVPKIEEKVEELIVKDDEKVEAVRQNVESTTSGGVIQQLLQNNPLTNFIQSIRPQSAASTTVKPAAAAASGGLSDEVTPVVVTDPPNFIQQIASGIQGLQANVQELFNGGGGGTQSLSGTPAPSPGPPFAFLTNLFPGQQAAQQSSQNGGTTGGNVPPNPIQGFLGLFNGNRGTQAPQVSQTTTVKVTTESPAPVPVVDDKVDELKGSEEINESSNETFENEPEIYVGEEENSAQIY